MLSELYWNIRRIVRSDEADKAPRFRLAPSAHLVDFLA